MIFLFGIGMSIAIDMYSTLSKNFNDTNFAKNVSILLSLICKDGCLGTDDFFSASKENYVNNNYFCPQSMWRTLISLN